MRLILMILFLFIIYKWFTWWLASAVLSAWIVENDYALPQKADRDRLAKWAVQKAFKLK